MTFKEKKKKNIPLDITPVVDTVFNLLIFFALSLNFTAASSLNVDLPKVSSQDVPREAQQTTVQIRKNGDLFLNETKVDIISLPGLLQHINSESIDHAVVVQADEAVTHGKVVNIMDICKNSGFNKLSIAANIK